MSIVLQIHNSHGTVIPFPFTASWREAMRFLKTVSVNNRPGHGLHRSHADVADVADLFVSCHADIRIQDVLFDALSHGEDLYFLAGDADCAYNGCGLSEGDTRNERKGQGRSHTKCLQSKRHDNSPSVKWLG